MCAKYGSVGRALVLGAAVMGFVTACHRSQSGLDHKLQEMAVIAERDSLLREVAANGKLLGEIQDELTKVQPKPAGGTPESPALEVTTDQRTFVMERVKEVTKRVKDLQTRLAGSEKRAGRLSRQIDSLGGEFSAAKATIEDLNAIVATQRENLTALAGQVEQLTGENLILSDSVFRLTDDYNTAFYVIGTRTELAGQGCAGGRWPQGCAALRHPRGGAGPRAAVAGVHFDRPNQHSADSPAPCRPEVPYRDPAEPGLPEPGQSKEGSGEGRDRDRSTGQVLGGEPVFDCG